MHTNLFSVFLINQTGIPQFVLTWKLISSLVTVIGALILWLGFFFMGIVAKRYQQVLMKKTNWQFIMTAPSGILLYAIIQFYSLMIVGNLKMTDMETWIAYSLFAISGLLSLIGASGFFKVVNPHKGGGK